MATTPATPAGNQVNLPFSYYRNKGTIVLASTLETRYRTLRENLRSLANWKKHKLCLLLSIHLLQLHVATKRNDVAYSLLLQTTMEPLPHGLLVLSSSKPLTGRTGYYRLRDASVYWNYRRYTLNRTLPLQPDKDSSYIDDMPCWLHSIEASTPCRTPSHKRHLAGDFASQLRVFASHLDIQDYSHQDYQTSRTTNHRR